MRFVLRLIGLVLAAGAFLAFVADGARAIASDDLVFTPVGTALDMWLPGTVATLREAVPPSVPEAVWDPGALWLLAQPSFAALAVLAALFMLLGRRPPRRFGLD